MSPESRSASSPEPSDSSPVPDGKAQRRVRTRAALLAAARELLAEGTTDVSIRVITERAGVGFGSFFNHFPGGKDELWTEAVLEILDRQSEWTMRATEHLSDPVEIFALAFRLTGRLAVVHPELMGPVVSRGLPVVFEQRGLRRAAEDVLAVGEALGGFAPMDRELRLATLGGALLGMIQLILADPAQGTEESVDSVAVSMLRSLGVADEEARRAVSSPLPEAPEFRL